MFMISNGNSIVSLSGLSLGIGAVCSSGDHERRVMSIDTRVNEARTVDEVMCLVDFDTRNYSDKESS